MSYSVSEAFQRIEEEMIASMSRNLKRHIDWEKKEGFEWTAWQAEQLAALKEYREQNREAFEGYFSTINDKIGEVIQKAYESGNQDQEIKILEAIKAGFKLPASKAAGNFQGSFFKINQRKIDALIKATKGELRAAETAMLRMNDDSYRKTIFDAVTYYNTGAGTLPQCVDMATKDFLSRGINCIEYSNGARVGIDVYARMALRTAETRAYVQGEATKRDEWGLNTVIVNKRGVACPKCLRYVGKVFYDDVWGNIEVTDDKYPKLSDAISGGLYHPNCKDIHTTYFEGVSSPPEKMTRAQVDEANRVYKLEQLQRGYERNIRKYKRLAAGSIDPENKKLYEAKLKEWQKAQTEFIEKNSDVLKRRYELEKIFPEPNGSSNNQVNPKSKNSVLNNSQKTSIINTQKTPSSLYDFKTIQGSHSLNSDLPKVNPKYCKSYRYQNNCGYCSACVELRRRGYDVEARPKDGLYVSDWQKLFKGFNIHRVKAKKKADALSELKSNIVLWGNGARGGIFVEWDGNAGGHFFNVEVINGKAVFIDGQSNKYGKVVENYFKRVKPSSILYGRWDTLKPTASIKSAVKNRL